MSFRISLMALMAILFTGLSAQDNPVLLNIADEQVSLAEFERIYRKNNNENSLNRQSPEEYLELFINFKLKVMEAEALGMDTTKKFKDELAGYREQLAKPYLADEETKEEIMREAYERSKTDIHASHVLIKLGSGAAPEDTLAAYNKIMDIRNRILKGEPFDVVARATSEDGSVSRNGGDLGYFTVFSMIYPFENVAYSTPVGELSMPFRTSYGYHILKVHDTRPARGKVQVAHIFVRAPEEMTDEGKKQAYEKAHMVYDSLMLGVSFEEMAGRYSEDPSSAGKGGHIPWFGTGRMIPEFENAAFGIEEIGGICKPVKSYFGWHIIKLLDKKGVSSYEEMKPELQEKAGRGERRSYQTKRYIAKLKEDYNFRLDTASLDAIRMKTDSSLIYGSWSGAGLEEDDAFLFSIENKNYTTGDFVSFILDKQALNKSKNPWEYAGQLFDRYVQQEVIAYEDSQLEVKYPEFRYIYEEYHDGILLFDIMDQKVWSKAVSDTLGLEKFHKGHENNYMWPERTEALLISCGEGADIDGLRKAAKKIMKGKYDQAKLNATFCSNDTLECITMEEIVVAAGENALVDNMNGSKGIGPLVEEEGRSEFIIVTGTRSPEPKALDDARGQITSDYQNYLEEQWIAELKDKYEVEVNRELLGKIKD